MNYFYFLVLERSTGVASASEGLFSELGSLSLVGILVYSVMDLHSGFVESSEQSMGGPGSKTPTVLPSCVGGVAWVTIPGFPISTAAPPGPPVLHEGRALKTASENRKSNADGKL